MPPAGPTTKGGGSASPSTAKVSQGALLFAAGKTAGGGGLRGCGSRGSAVLTFEVAAQAAAGREAELADMAAVRLLPRVHHLVVEESCGIAEALRAHGATVGPFPRVAPDVVHQVEGMLEALDAVRALERLQLRVPGKMAAQVRAVPEALVTLGAVKGGPGTHAIVHQKRWVILCVRVQNGTLVHTSSGSPNAGCLKGALALWPLFITVLHLPNCASREQKEDSHRFMELKGAI